jgi:hypothetical protein
VLSMGRLHGISTAHGLRPSFMQTESTNARTRTRTHLLVLAGTSAIRRLSASSIKYTSLQPGHSAVSIPPNAAAALADDNLENVAYSASPGERRRDRN